MFMFFWLLSVVFLPSIFIIQYRYSQTHNPFQLLIIIVYVVACKERLRAHDSTLAAAAIFMGLTWSIGMVESSHPWMGFIFSLLLVAAMGYSLTQLQHPFTAMHLFAGVLAVVCYCCLLRYSYYHFV